MISSVRIIGGKFRGKKISFPAVPGLRPTPNRVRETLFNWLMYDIKGSICLDAFAGSGSLGLEAYSRGAKQVVFLENNREIFKHLEKLITSFNDENLIIKNIDAITFLNTNSQFNIIFLDPPFAANYLPWIQTIENSEILIKNGLLYIESANNLELNPLKWQLLNSKQAGQVHYALWQKL